MIGLISGETVKVSRTKRTLDALGEAISAETESETVENVLVCPGATADLDSTRPNGVTVAYTLCFPKGYEGDLKDAAVTVRGSEFKVVGDPQRYAEANTPGPWNLTCEVTRTDG